LPANSRRRVVRGYKSSMGLSQSWQLPPPFDEAVRAHEREIMRYLLRMTADREDALDLFQETWLRAYRAYPQIKAAAGLRPWLYRIATNLCRNRARDNFRRSKVMVSADPAGEAISAAPARDGWDGVIHIKAIVAKLPPKQRMAIMMRKFGGLGYREIGAALDCSEESARASVYQAMKKLEAAK
jgi:RNA polymerase sigma-70 factor (ECF subfamily)